MKRNSCKGNFIRISTLITLLVCVFAGCSKTTSALRLNKSIGIITVGDVYSEIIPAGQSIPHTFSESFGNADDGQQAVEISLAQRDESGIEKICVVVVNDLPPKPENGLHIIVTIKIDSDKNMRVKAAVSETGYVNYFGPFLVE